MSVMSDEETYKLLRDKIKSKMDVTKFFSGFVSIIFSILMKDTITSPTTNVSIWIFLLGIIFTVLSVSLSIAALFSYDRLLMPPNFIKGTQLLKSINKDLKVYMIQAWKGLFLPSIVCFILALIFFAYAKININFSVPLWQSNLVAILVAFVTILLPLLLYVKFKSPSEYPD